MLRLDAAVTENLVRTSVNGKEVIKAGPDETLPAADKVSEIARKRESRRQRATATEATRGAGVFQVHGELGKYPPNNTEKGRIQRRTLRLERLIP